MAPKFPPAQPPQRLLNGPGRACCPAPAEPAAQARQQSLLNGGPAEPVERAPPFLLGPDLLSLNWGTFDASPRPTIHMEMRVVLPKPTPVRGRALHLGSGTVGITATTGHVGPLSERLSLSEVSKVCGFFGPNYTRRLSFGCFRLLGRGRTALVNVIPTPAGRFPSFRLISQLQPPSRRKCPTDWQA